MRSFLNELIQQVEVLSMTEILTQILVAAALGFVIYLSYYMSHTGTIYSRKFNTSLVVLAVLTTVVMTAIGNNVTVSRGMVGALSIVRFRAAIKEPEELTYLFIAIGIGLATGANQPILAVLTFSFILVLLYLNQRLFKKQHFRHDNKLFVNIHTDSEDLKHISTTLSDILPFVSLKRLDYRKNGGLDLTFICMVDNLEQLDTLTNSLKNISPATTFSVVEAPELSL